MWQSGVWLCIMPGMPMHLVQELNVGTVGLKYFSIRVFSIFHYSAFTARGDWIMRRVIMGMIG